jgi:hypothetical protein
VYIEVMDERHAAPDHEQVEWNLLSVQVLQHHPEYAMTLQTRKENHTVPDRTARRTADPITGRIAVHDPLVSAGLWEMLSPE